MESAMYQVSNYNDNIKVRSSTIMKVGKYRYIVLRKMHSGLNEKMIALCRLIAVAKKGSKDRRNSGKE
jgi:hypothetical protein